MPKWSIKTIRRYTSVAGPGRSFAVLCGRPIFAPKPVSKAKAKAKGGNLSAGDLERLHGPMLRNPECAQYGSAHLLHKALLQRRPSISVTYACVRFWNDKQGRGDADACEFELRIWSSGSLA